MAVARYEIVIRPIEAGQGADVKLREAMTTCEWCPYNVVIREGRLERTSGYLEYKPKEYGCSAAGGRLTEKHIPDWCPMGLGAEKEGRQ